MRRVIMRWGIALVLILLIIYSGFATYKWRDEKGKEEVKMGYAVALADIPLSELADVGFALEYLIKQNATDELLNERVSMYSSYARTLHYSSAILYASTKNEKYQLFGTTMRNLEEFFITAKNKPNSREILKDNLNVLKQIGYILKETKRINYLTFTDAEKILELSNELKS